MNNAILSLPYWRLLPHRGEMGQGYLSSASGNVSGSGSGSGKSRYDLRGIIR